MSDFNLLDFLKINVPNDPPSPITLENQNFKILAPTKKFKEPSNSGNNVFNLNQTQSTPPPVSRQGGSSPYFKTTYSQSFGSSTESTPKPQEEEVPSTPTSVSSITSTISACNDCTCDECLNKQQTADKKALAEAEKNLEQAAIEKERKRVREEIENEKVAEEEKKKKDRQTFNEDQQRIHAEKAAALAQRQKEEEEYAEMQRSLSREDTSEKEAQKERSREHLHQLLGQIEDTRARRQAELVESKQPAASSIPIPDIEEERRRAQAAAADGLLRALHQQVADRKAGRAAEKEAEAEEVRKKVAADDAEFFAREAEAQEKHRIQAEEFLRENRNVINGKNELLKAADEEEKAFARAQVEADAAKAEEEKRQVEEKRRAELEALHRHLVAQVQRRKEALERQRQEDRSYAPGAPPQKTQIIVHCGQCKRDLPPERFSNYIVTPNGKVYQRSKARKISSPIHKYLYTHKQPSAPYQFE